MVQDSPAGSGLRPDSTVTASPAEHVPDSSDDHAPVFARYSNPPYEAQSSVQQTKPFCKNRGTLQHCKPRFKETASNRKTRIWAAINKLPHDKKEWAKGFGNPGADFVAGLASLLEDHLQAARENVARALYHRYRKACDESLSNIDYKTQLRDITFALEIAAGKTFLYDEAALSAVVDKSAQPIRLRSGSVSDLQGYEELATRPLSPYLATPHLSAIGSKQSFGPLAQVTPMRAIDVDHSSFSRMHSSEPKRSARLKNSNSRSEGQKRSRSYDHPISKDRPRKTVKFGELTALQNDSDTIRLVGDDPSDLCVSVQSQPEMVCQHEPHTASEDQRVSESEEGLEPGSNDGIGLDSERTAAIKIESRYESEERSQHESEDKGETESPWISASVVKNVGGEREQGQTSCRSEPQAMEVQEDRTAITELSAKTDGPNPQGNVGGVTLTSVDRGTSPVRDLGTTKPAEPDRAGSNQTSSLEKSIERTIWIQLNTTENNKQQFLKLGFDTSVQDLFSLVQDRMHRRVSGNEVISLKLTLPSHAKEEDSYLVEKDDPDTWEVCLDEAAGIEDNKIKVKAAVEVSA